MNRHVEIATGYARAVVSGEILASKWTRLACERQLEDLDREASDEWPWVFDQDRASRPCEFIQLLPHVKGKWAKEKRLIGKCWEQQSKGQGLFLMARKLDDEFGDVVQQIRKKLLASP